jgi:hypothetical protein
MNVFLIYTTLRIYPKILGDYENPPYVEYFSDRL